MVKKTTNIRSKLNDVTFQKEPQGFLQFLRQRNPYLFAHHPDHPAFKDHVWVSHGLFFCKGCSVTFAGMIFGVFLYLPTKWLEWFSDVQIGFIFLALLIPTLIATLLSLPRIVKHVARFLLGILMTSALLMLFITNSWAIRFAIVFTYLAIKIPLKRKRHNDNEKLITQFTQFPKQKSTFIKK
jgi:uncharacterized membrane protein